MEFLLDTPFGFVTTTKPYFSDTYSNEYMNELTRQMLSNNDSSFVLVSWGKRAHSEIFISPDFAKQCKFILDGAEIELNRNMIMALNFDGSDIALNSNVTIKIARMPERYAAHPNITYNKNEYIFINSTRQLRLIPKITSENQFYDIVGTAKYKRGPAIENNDIPRYRKVELRDKMVLENHYKVFYEDRNDYGTTENKFTTEALIGIEINYNYNYTDINGQTQTINMIEIISIDSIKRLYYQFEDEYDKDIKYSKYSNFGVIDITYKDKSVIELQHKITKEKRKAILPNIRFTIDLTKFGVISTVEEEIE